MNREVEMNRIPEVQNEAAQIERLAAQRALHCKEKLVVVIQIILTAIVPVFLSYLLLGRQHRLRAWIAFCAAAIALIDAFFLDWLQRRFRRQAVLIQELFDTEVLALEWPSWQVGDKPDPETVTAESKNYIIRHGAESFHSWYPEAIGGLPLLWARLVCQRANLWYDISLRRRYIHHVALLLTFLAMVPFGVSLAKRAGVEELILTIIAPLLPVMLWSTREATRHRAALMQSEDLKKFIDRILAQDMAQSTEPKLERYARSIQDGILGARLSRPPVFEWFYRLFRRSNEETMKEGARKLVDDISRRLNARQF